MDANTIKKWLAIKSIELGVASIRQIDNDLSTKNDKSNILVLSSDKLGLSPVLLDEIYYYTSWDKWQTIIQFLNDITASFKWEAERFDCDKRSALICCLVSLLYRLNTCMQVYCKVFDLQGNFKYLHYCNIIVDDNGNTYLWDADNGGLSQKITTNNVVMGNNKYQFLSLRTI